MRKIKAQDSKYNPVAYVGFSSNCVRISNTRCVPVEQILSHLKVLIHLVDSSMNYWLLITDKILQAVKISGYDLTPNNLLRSSCASFNIESRNLRVDLNMNWSSVELLYNSKILSCCLYPFGNLACASTGETKGLWTSSSLSVPSSFLGESIL